MIPGLLDYKVMHYLPRDIILYAERTELLNTLKDGIIIYKDQGADAYFPADQMTVYIKAVLEKIKHEPAWVRSIHEQCRKINKEYIAYARLVESKDIGTLSNEEIIEMSARLSRLQIEGHLIAVSTTWFVDSDGELLAKHIIEKLKHDLSGYDDEELMRAYTVLTTPSEQNFSQAEETDFLRLALTIGKDAYTKNIFDTKKGIEARFETMAEERRSLLIEHYKKWRWTPYTYVGPAYHLEHYLYALADFFASGQDAASTLREAEERNEVIKEKQKQLLNRLPISEQTGYFLGVARDIIWLKDFRKYAMFYGFYCMDLLRKEAARRLCVSLTQINHLTEEEFNRALKSGHMDTHIVNERRAFSVLSYIDGRQNILTGEAAEFFVQSLEFEKELESDADELQGSCACPGDIVAKVKVVNTVAEMDKMNEGDIMLAHTTFPSLLPAMRKAGAIVTEDGGVTCHAAIVSRELNIPCVVGVKNVTRLLADGDKVRVDATHGKVERL